MKRARRRYPWDEDELLKAPLELSEGLNVGIREEFDSNGQLFIYLKPGKVITPYIVLGKYATDERVYYVADWTKQGLNPTTTYHDHLMLAVAKIMELVAENEKGLEP